MIRECGQIEQELAREQAEHESKVEQLVSNPLQPIIDNELPNVIKLKRNLNKYMLDKDSIKNRYHVSDFVVFFLFLIHLFTLETSVINSIVVLGFEEW